MRPWPAPRMPWLLHQWWEDLLFAHWPVSLHELRPRVPPALPIDTFDGSAWLGIVPFTMRSIRPRLMPAIPKLSSFLEVNVRTYVTVDGKPGVYFLSLDANNPRAVSAARSAGHLAYFNAEMYAQRDGATVHYASHRTHHGARSADLIVSYRPSGPGDEPPAGSLTEWLTARYCLYAADRRGRITRIEVDHRPWRLHPATAEIAVNTMACAHRIALPDRAPLLHYARRMDVRTWWPEPVRHVSVG
jgi:uncharacterized protein YqjF (DUF2071 family)